MDPKTVLCLFYKQGNCEKGRKCKFSHDLAVERKGEKKDLYQDTREGEEEAKQKDDMVDWDEGSFFSEVRRIIVVVGSDILTWGKTHSQKNYAKWL